LDPVQSRIAQTQPLYDKKEVRVGIVGPCGAGKTTLINSLRLHSLNAQHIAQEHSFVLDMWQRISKPDILIFLDVSFSISQQRRPLDWQISDFEEQLRRLLHAREYANLLINTDNLSTNQVLNQTLAYLNDTGILLNKSNGKNKHL
jgi:deoxyadenosine/deoxycytidine kinase